MEATEKQIQNAILKYLNLQEGCFAFQVNTTGVYDPVKKIYRKPGRYVIKGTADILCAYAVKDIGIFIAFEVKSEKGQLTEDQHKFGDIVKFRGRGFYFVVRSLQEVVEALSDVKHAVTARMSD